MKSLKEYVILEMANFTQPEMKQIFGKATAQVGKFVNYFEKFLSNLKKEYSVGNKTDRGYLWNIFRHAISASSVSKEQLKEYHCDTPDNLARILGDNADLINSKIGKNYIKTNLSKAQKEFKTWKETDEYVPLQDYDPNDPYEDDEELGRAWCIYYAWDPGDTELVKVFRINGKTTDKNVEHEINMHRVDWNYEFKLGYYHANPCLVDYYRKSGKEELMNDFIGEND